MVTRDTNSGDIKVAPVKVLESETALGMFWHKYLRQPYRLHVIDHGGDGPVIIFLHGIAASSDKWSYLIPQLQADFHCISIDLVGFGQSPKPQWYSYTMDDHLRCIHRTIRGLKLKQPFILAGHSLGSLLASRYACLSPKSVRQLVLLSPPVYAPLDTLRSITSKTARARNQLLLKIYLFLRTNRRMTLENFKRLSYILPLPKSVWRYPETRIPFIRSLKNCIETQTISEDLAHCDMPIDIFYGSLDQVVVAFNIRQLKSIKNLHVYGIRGVNHDIGKRYANAVATFLLAGK
jgi:pimeloyl-ACP methyl ester carboxylesterase